MAKAKKLIIDRVNFDPTANEICEESQVVSLIKKMPKDLVDLYLLSGGSTKFANFIDGIPVIRPLVNEKSFSYIELILSDNKINSEKTIIHQPVILCDSFNKASKDCFSLDKSVKLEKSEPATFLDLPIIKQ